MDIDEFFTELKERNSDKDLLDFCRKYVLHGTPFVFQSRDDDFYEFRKRIGEKFHISFHEIYITGSAKLGFSPHKRKEFDYDADVDVALISPRLFESIMNDIARTVGCAERSEAHRIGRDNTHMGQVRHFTSAHPYILILSFKGSELLTGYRGGVVGKPELDICPVFCAS
jgi:hypothetical protein